MIHPVGFFLFGMGSSTNTHQHKQTPRTDTGTCERTHAHLHTCMHRCNKNGRHTFEPLLAEVDSQGGELGTFFFFPFSFSFLWSYLLTLVKDPPSLFWVLMLCCCVFSNYRAWQWARTHKEYCISDAIISLAACKMNQIVSIGLTNGLGFNFVSTIGPVASVCVTFRYFLPFKITLILLKKY